MKPEELLAQRYGRSSKNKARERGIFTILAASLLIGFLVWAIAVTSAGSERVTAEVKSFYVLNDQQTEVTIVVDRPRADPIVCQVEVLDTRYTIVGYREALFLSNSSAEQTVLVNTTSKGVTGVAKNCWFK
jgi:hypothetical protein